MHIYIEFDFEGYYLRTVQVSFQTIRHSESENIEAEIFMTYIAGIVFMV